jgi:two-component system sensor histidine kinase UhpB
VIIASPEDELNEIGDEFTFVSILLLSLTTIVLAVVWWSVSRAMRPLHLLQEGLGRLEQGDFSTLLPPFSIPELQPIGDTFNHLSKALGQAQDENRQLIHKLLSVQETERAELAQDFHDELGPCLFGIKTEAACIARNADALAPDEAKTRAAAIAKLVEDLQHLNRRVLGKLRPIALAELGLRAALDRLVAEWRDRAPGIRWVFECTRYDSDPPETQALALFRVAQEAMTNAARHSGAQSVKVVLECAQWARLQVVDDGRGLVADARRGFGLLGIRERVQALGGSAKIENGPDGGVMVDVALPLGEK